MRTAENWSRDEHLTWCKERALEFVDNNDLAQAFASMGSDLNKHSATKDHPGIQLGMGLLMIGDLGTADKMRKFINGFN